MLDGVNEAERQFFFVYQEESMCHSQSVKSDKLGFPVKIPFGFFLFPPCVALDDAVAWHVQMDVLINYGNILHVVFPSFFF